MSCRMPVWSAVVVSCLFAVSAAAQSSDMFVTKSGPATAAINTDVTYTITVGNIGPDDAPNARFTDTLPTGATFVSENQTAGPIFTCSTPNVGDEAGTVMCSIGTLVAGDSATFSIVVHVLPAAAGTTLINTVTTTSDNPDDSTENNSSITGTDVAGGNLADVAISKSGPSSAPANTDITYTITLSNNGTNAATNVSWTDTLPSGTPAGNPMTFVSFNQTTGPAFNCPNPGTTVTCTIATFPAGSTATFQYVGHIPNTAGAGTTYSNVATVMSDNDPTPENNSSEATTTVSSADVGVNKTAPATATAGGANFDYIVSVSNGGPDTATDVSFIDNLPSGINFVSLVQNTGPAASCSTPPQTVSTIACDIPALGNGQNAQFTITVNAASTVANGTIISNTANVSSASADTNPNNNSSTAPTTISANADLSISKSGSANVAAGTNITYTINLANNGPSTATNAFWTDTLPAGTTFVSLTQNSGPTFNCTTGATVTCNIGSLAPGATATFTLVVQTSASAANGTTVSNTVNISSPTPDSTPGNNSSTAPTTTLSTSADLSVAKSAPTAATAGSNVTYTINIANGGPSDAATVTLSDVLPAGTTFVSENQTSGPAFNCTTGATVTCSIASFPTGATASFTITVAFSPGLGNGTIVTNTANISSTTSDPNPTNNSSSAPTTVGANADLSVTKSGPTFTASTTNVTYTVTATNSGPSNTSTVSLTETVPANMNFVSVNQTNGPLFNCTGTGPIVCTIATLNAGASATFQFTFFVTNAPQGTQTSNTATISSTTIDPNPTNNSSTVNTTIGLPVPAMSDVMLALLALTLVGIAVFTMRR